MTSCVGGGGGSVDENGGDVNTALSSPGLGESSNGTRQK